MHLHILQVLQLLLLLVHHLLLVLFLDHNILDSVLCYLNRVRSIHPYLRICRTHRGWLCLHHSMALNTLDQQGIAIRPCFEIFISANTNLWSAWLLFIAHLLQREVTNMLVLRKHYTTLAIPWIFVPTILLVLRRVYCFDRWLLLGHLSPLIIQLIIII